MLDTKSLKLEKDTDGKVSLSEVIDLLKELQHEVHCSVQQIKTEKARKNSQKLYGIPKSSQRNRGSHLRLISGNDRSKQEIQNIHEKLLRKTETAIRHAQKNVGKSLRRSVRIRDIKEAKCARFC